MNSKEKHMIELSMLEDISNGKMPDRTELAFSKEEFEDFMLYFVKNKYIDNLKFTDQYSISICKDVRVTSKGMSYIEENRQLIIKWKTPIPVKTDSIMDIMKRDGYSIEERIYMQRMFEEE